MKSRISWNTAVGPFAIAVLIASCTSAAPTPSAGEVQTVVAVTFAAMTLAAPTHTPSPPSPTERDEPAPVFVPYKVRIVAQNVNLRIGPGRLFQVSRVLAQGTTLEVTGISRGGEWFYVVNPEGISSEIRFGLVHEQYHG
jgi:SH3-like domain-containing protein